TSRDNAFPARNKKNEPSAICITFMDQFFSCTAYRLLSPITSIIRAPGIEPYQPIRLMLVSFLSPVAMSAFCSSRIMHALYIMHVLHVVLYELTSRFHAVIFVRRSFPGGSETLLDSLSYFICNRVCQGINLARCQGCV